MTIGRFLRPLIACALVWALGVSVAEARFLQADPAGNKAGPNLYTYVTNDPLNLTDARGLAPDQELSLRPEAGSAGFGGGGNGLIGGIVAAAAGGSGGGGGDDDEFGNDNGILSAGLGLGGDLTRVGRWMSQDEFDAMSETGTVQEGAGGRTYVVNPPNPAAYQSAAPGSVYSEFNVPTDSLFPAGKPEWSVIPGPNVTTQLYGPAPASMPPATCIVCVIGGGSP